MIQKVDLIDGPANSQHASKGGHQKTDKLHTNSGLTTSTICYILKDQECTGELANAKRLGRRVK